MRPTCPPPFVVALALPGLLLASCHSPHPTPASSTPPDLQRFEYTRPQMGVPFRLVLYATNPTQANLAAEAAYQRLATLNSILSDYEDDSELTLLSKSSGTGQWVPVSPELWTVLERAQALAHASQGAFDITSGPLVQLWRRARRQRQLPDPARLHAARQAVGFQKLELDPRQRRARLLVPRMRLDLGGIAKGYGVDQALAVLRQHGINRALVAGSGDMAFGDPPPGRPGWQIEVAPLDVTNAPPARFVRLRNCAIATSGDVFQHVEIDGRRYSHIVDPRTGLGLTDHSLVTVIAPDCITADSLATAVSVLGPKAGFRLVDTTRNAAAHLVRKPAQKIETAETKRFRRFEEKDLSLAPIRQ